MYIKIVFSPFLFTKKKNGDIMVVPNELNNRNIGIFFLYGGVIPFLQYSRTNYIWKKCNSRSMVLLYLFCGKSSFGDSLELAFFGASASAGALFDFKPKKHFFRRDES